VAVETTRDAFAGNTLSYQGFGYQTDVELLWSDLAHEIGHQFGLGEATTGVMGPAEASNSDRFHPDELAEIRGDDRSPGHR
jgi:hypothetical protein